MPIGWIITVPPTAQTGKDIGPRCVWLVMTVNLGLRESLPASMDRAVATIAQPLQWRISANGARSVRNALAGCTLSSNPNEIPQTIWRLLESLNHSRRNGEYAANAACGIVAIPEASAARVKTVTKAPQSTAP